MPPKTIPGKKAVVKKSPVASKVSSANSSSAPSATAKAKAKAKADDTATPIIPSGESRSRGLQVKYKYGIRFLGEYASEDDANQFEEFRESWPLVKSMELKSQACKVLNPGDEVDLLLSDAGRNSMGVAMTKGVARLRFCGSTEKLSPEEVANLKGEHAVSDAELAAVVGGWSRGWDSVHGWKFTTVEKYEPPFYLPTGPQAGGWVLFHRSETSSDPEQVSAYVSTCKRRP